MEWNEREEKRNFIIENLMNAEFIESRDQEIVLEEKADAGKSELKVKLVSKGNLCIANVDDKKTDIPFFQPDKEKCMKKRVDHMIFEPHGQDQWRLHLIEMKSTVGKKTWGEIKGKFRASYLVAQAIAAMLEINLSDTVMYTTFEKACFTALDTMPVGRRGNLGKQLVRMEDEWEGSKFGLDFGVRIPFLHRPILMTRNGAGVLTGELVWNGSERLIEAGDKNLP